MTSETSPPRSRRTGEEIRARLLDAGRATFAERGYAGASTKEIAQRAEVAEVLLFRHFGNKAGLFDEAVLDPFEQFVDEWVSRWTRHGLCGDSVEEMAHDYLQLLYQFFEDNRELLVALLAARGHHETTAGRLDGIFGRLEQTVREGVAEHDLPIREPAITVRLTFGMVLSTVVHSDILFPSGVPLSRKKLINGLTRYMLHGIAHAS
jgi:AcrR family transcriptional regulator